MCIIKTKDGIKTIVGLDMSLASIDEIGNRFKNKLPKGVHGKINEMMGEFKDATILLASELSDVIVTIPLLQMVTRLEGNDLKPVQAMKTLTQQSEWVRVFTTGVKNGTEINSDLTADLLKNLQSAYLKERGGGRQVTLSILMERAKHFTKTKVESSCESNDITASNIIVALTEIVADAEMSILDAFPSAKKHLETKEFHKIVPIKLTNSSDWALKQIELGKANRVSIRDLVLKKREELVYSIKLYELFKPLLFTSHTIVSLMPVLLTMLCENKPGLDKVRDDCNNIFMEFSMGAQLERLTISLKEKYVKKRGIDELEINATAIKKNFQKIIDALNFNVISYLRRMKLSTIIEGEIFDNAKCVGIDLTGLNSKFGFKKAPEYFDDIKLESIRKISDSISQYFKLMKNRLSEEIGVTSKPNLVSLNDLIGNLRTEIEKNYQMIPTQIAPLFAGPLVDLEISVQRVNTFLEPLKHSSLILILNDTTKKEQFYKGLKDLYRNLELQIKVFKDFVDLGINLALADQQIALLISEYKVNEESHSVGYPEIFEKSIKRVQQMKMMKTLSASDAATFKSKVENAQKYMKSWVSGYTKDRFKDIIKKGHSFKN